MPSEGRRARHVVDVVVEPVQPRFQLSGADRSTSSPSSISSVLPGTVDSLATSNEQKCGAHCCDAFELRGNVCPTLGADEATVLAPAQACFLRLQKQNETRPVDYTFLFGDANPRHPAWRFSPTDPRPVGVGMHGIGAPLFARAARYFRSVAEISILDEELITMHQRVNGSRWCLKLWSGVAILHLVWWSSLLRVWWSGADCTLPPTICELLSWLPWILFLCPIGLCYHVIQAWRISGSKTFNVNRFFALINTYARGSYNNPRLEVSMTPEELQLLHQRRQCLLYFVDQTQFMYFILSIPLVVVTAWLPTLTTPELYVIWALGPGTSLLVLILQLLIGARLASPFEKSRAPLLAAPWEMRMLMLVRSHARVFVTLLDTVFFMRLLISGAFPPLIACSATLFVSINFFQTAFAAQLSIVKTRWLAPLVGIVFCDAPFLAMRIAAMAHSVGTFALILKNISNLVLASSSVYARCARINLNGVRREYCHDGEGIVHVGAMVHRE